MLSGIVTVILRHLDGLQIASDTNMLAVAGLELTTYSDYESFAF